MVEEVKVTRNYQVTLPASIRALVGVKIGDTLVVDVEKEKIVLERKDFDITKLGLRIGRKVDWRDVEQATKEAGEKALGRGGRY